LIVNKILNRQAIIIDVLDYGLYMTDLRKVLASNMKFYRSQRGLSQEKLAEIADITTNYIALIETSKRFPSLRMLEKLAEGLNVDTTELFSLNPNKITAKKSLRTKILTDIEQILTIRLEEIED
jgi:transcriptional regulator with XRE-family HTH domain